MNNKVVEYIRKRIEEDAPTNSAGGGAVAAIGVGPDGEPGANTWLKNHLNFHNPKMKLQDFVIMRRLNR